MYERLVASPNFGGNMTGLDHVALRRVCEEVAKSTMWQTPAPRNLGDIISSDEIEETIRGYFESASREAELLAQAGEDPNIVISAVDYLACYHAIPPMRDDQRWFREALFTLLVLARPSITGGEPSDHPFLDEVLRGVAEARRQKR